jgi:hypothetical protein
VRVLLGEVRLEIIVADPGRAAADDYSVAMLVEDPGDGGVGGENATPA